MSEDVHVSEDARMTEDMLVELLSASASSLTSTRRINQEKIEAVDQDVEVAVKNILQELQIMREMYEDAILFLYNMKPPFDSFEEALAKLMVALKKHISLQESLFKSAEVPVKLAPSSLVSIKYEPSENNEDSAKIETDPDMRLEIFTNSSLPNSFENSTLPNSYENSTLPNNYDSLKIKIETDESLEESVINDSFFTNDDDQKDLWPEDEDYKPSKVKYSNSVKVKEESGENSRKKLILSVGKKRKKGGGGEKHKKPVKCDQCFRELVNMQSLKNHMEWHKREKRSFECEKCGKKFKIEACFKKHQESHLKVKTEERHDRWRCEYCAKGFDNQGNLVKHLKTHTGEKPHACDLCESAFITHFKLKEHMRTHTGEKPFECEDCGRMFSTKNLRQRHRNSSHLGIKPYSCKLCGKAFSRSDHLKQHIGQMHSKMK